MTAETPLLVLTSDPHPSRSECACRAGGDPGQATHVAGESAGAAPAPLPEPPPARATRGAARPTAPPRPDPGAAAQRERDLSQLTPRACPDRKVRHDVLCAGAPGCRQRARRDAGAVGEGRPPRRGLDHVRTTWRPPHRQTRTAAGLPHLPHRAASSR